MNITVLEVVTWEEPIIENFSYENSVNIAQVEYIASGWLTGKLMATYVIHYLDYNPENPAESHSTFSGYTVFEGEIAGRKGKIVFGEHGSNINGVVSNLTIKEGTGSGRLRDLDGEGQYTVENNQIILRTNF